MRNLEAKTIPLNGRHIIEASAGTGKTYNITELYIRLLLEKKLLPKQILVMTFTRDATQEIIGRVEDKLREVLVGYCQDRKEKDKENYQHLKRSLLEIDEAAIFTIHGFCKKILSEQAFASNMEMDVSMEVDTSDILQKVVEDFFRKNINNSQINYEYLKVYNFHTPDRFLDINALLNVVRSNYQIKIDEPVGLKEFNMQKQRQLKLLEDNKDIVEEFLSKLGKGELEGKRASEYSSVLEWLKLDDDSSFPCDVSILINGNKIKAAKIKPIFMGIKELKQLQIETKRRYAARFIRESCLKIRKDFIAAKEQKNVLDFDDLISKLRQSVKASSDLVKTLQQQYPVALIDEFQDTDTEQYQILDTIYPKNREDLLFLMIGDPKQAIYSFRGGDIFTYLKAKNSCDEENQWSMDTNWRSTPEIIKAYNRLFYKNDYEDSGLVGRNVFSEGIDYQIVKSSPITNNKSMSFDDNLKSINYFFHDVLEDDKKNDIDIKLSNWLSNEIVRLLNIDVVKEHEIAILVENRTQAKIVEESLNKKGLGSVYLSQRENVYKSKQADEVLYLMEGINDLENKTLLKKALSTSLLGGSIEKFISYLDEENLDIWDTEIEQIRQLRIVWQKYGFMALIMKVIHENFRQRDENKQRVITNILHLAELIKIAENKYKHPNQLIKWYRRQLKGQGDAEGELRLERDDSLIKIITIHGSKGLEYPVVFVPFAASVSTKKFDLKDVCKYYDHHLEQTIYKIGRDDITKKIIAKEIVEELMRLLYVAVTRAEYRCYIGVAKYQSKKGGAKLATDDSHCSPLAQFLEYSRGDNWLEKINILTENSNNQSMLIKIDQQQEISLKESDEYHEMMLLEANKINNLDFDNWEMLSFSKISKTSAQNIMLEKEYDEIEDEKDLQQSESLEFRFTAPRGAEIGNMLHNILEFTDFNKGEVDYNLLKEQINKYKVISIEYLEELKKWIEEVLSTPIPEIDSNNYFNLKSVSSSRILKEAEFYFPIKNKKLYKRKVLRILEEYRGTKVSLDEVLDYKIFGMLHGFIDLIFEYNGKFYVGDYKSNYLGDTLEDYSQQSMCEKNYSSFYDLQYLIYSLALNKYLKQNISDYSFDRHFGGVYYFYLRGMSSNYGVYFTKPSLCIIDKLNSLFIGDCNNV